MPPVAAPAPRPAQGFTAARAQRWILAAALISAVMYGFRRVVEPSMNAAPARGGKAARLAGAGSPPPALAHWAVAYGAGFTLLSILSLGAPEVAASLAMLMVAGEAITNGTALLADLTGLEQGTTPATTSTPASSQPAHVDTVSGPFLNSIGGGDFTQPSTVGGGFSNIPNVGSTNGNGFSGAYGGGHF